MSASDDDLGIIGYGSSIYEKEPTHSEFGYLWNAAAAALASAGIRPSQVDGLAISSTTLGGDNAVTAAEHFGLNLRWACGSIAGGAGSLVNLMRAVEAVRLGNANAVLCLAGGRQSRLFFHDRVAAFNEAVGTYLAPQGVGGMNGLFALIQKKHMNVYGTDELDLARIPLAQRENAARNSRALFREPLTMAQYLDAPLIADPLRLYDCVLPCSGAEAVVIARAGATGAMKLVRVLATGEAFNYPAETRVPVNGGWEIFRDRFYEAAGYGPNEADFFQCYDDYPIMVAIQIEDMGFCKKGRVGDFLRGHDLRWCGDFPLNTSGGQLSCGQAGGAGGMLALTEAVQQLFGEAGERQVAGARRGVVSGYGMVAYGHGLAASGLYLEAGHA
jgi:acetyl-CoA acetyltransferase